MYSVDEGNNDIDRYFKIIENEARELRECNPQSGSKPNFNKNRVGVDNYTSGGGSQTSNYNGGDYNSRSNNYENKSEGGYGGSRNYGGSSNNYGGGSSNYGGNSGYGGGGSNSYGGGGSNSYGGGGSNSYGGGGSNSGYGGGSNTGTDSNSYGGGNSGYGAGSNNYGGGSSSYGGGGGTNSYGGGGSSSYGGGGTNSYGGGGTNSYGGGGSNDTSAGTRTSGYGGSSNYGGSNNHGGASDYGSSSNQAQPSFNAPNPSSVATDDWGAKQDFNEPSNNSSNDYRSSNTNYGNEKSYGSEVASNNYDSSSQSQYKSDYNAQTADQSKPYAASTRSVPPSFASPITEDVDGYQRLDFNRSLISYNEPGNLNIKHIFLNILNRSDLMAYTTKIMECACQDKIVLAIQRDNQLAESYASQLRERGFWAFEVTNKTADPEKLLKQHSVYRCAITTMSYLRDNVDMFQFPSLIINFDHVVSHVKFLERFLAYRNPSTALERKDCCIYEMCFNHSTTSQNLKEYIQSQNK